MITFIVRALFTILILCGVYSETGVWTTTSFALLFVFTEVTAVILKKAAK